jgi:hypothetical protein
MARRARGGRLVVDTGVHLFFDGQFFFRQIDTLAITLCVAKDLPDDEWDRYFTAVHLLTKKYGQPTKVSLVMFTEAIPSAAQRGRLAAYLKAQNVPQLLRIGLITESAIVRGALTAFGWIMPRTTMRAFAMSDLPDCLKWLHEGALFDHAKATTAWVEGRRLVGLDK